MIRKSACTGGVFALVGFLLSSSAFALPSWRDGALARWVRGAHHIRNSVCTNGTLTGQVSGGDPFWTTGVKPFAPTATQTVVFRGKSPVGGTGELYWAPVGAKQPTAKTGVRFTWKDDGEWHEYRVRPYWQGGGDIRIVRIDFPPKAFGEGEVGLADVRIVDEGPAERIPIGDAMGVSFSYAGRESVRCDLLWASDAVPGLQKTPVVLVGDGRRHTYYLSLCGNRAWRGNLVMRRLVRRGTEDEIKVDDLAFCKDEPELPPDLVTVGANFVTPACRAGTDGRIEVVVRNLGTDEAKAVSLKALDVPSDLVCRAEGAKSVAGDGSELLALTVRGDRPVKTVLKVAIVLDGKTVSVHDVPVSIGPSLGLPACDYVPEPRPVRSEYEIGALYFPGWETAKAWKRVWKTCPERRPFLGWYDEAKPEVVDWQIKWLVENGINALYVDWYWQKGYRHHEHWIKAFQQARYRKYLKWAVMWANHTPAGSHSEADQREVTKYWLDHYFNTPEYLTRDGKPVVWYWQGQNMDRDLGAGGCKKLLDLSRRLAVEAGYKGIHFIAMKWPEAVATPAVMQTYRDMGFDEVGIYHFMDAGGKAENPRRFSYRLVADANPSNWRDQHKAGVLPFLPNLSTGWDDRPWNDGCEIYGKNVADFRRICTAARAFADQTGIRRLCVAPLNEWGEGSYAEPNAELGFSFYEAVRETFCEKPSGGWPVNFTPADVGLGPYDLPQPPQPIKATDWDFAQGGPQGWRAFMGCTLPERTGEGLVFSTTSHDPALDQSFAMLRAERFASVVVRMKAEKARGRVALFWARDREGMHEGAHLALPVIADGRFHDYVFKVAGHRQWKGLVGALRVDPCENADARITLASVRLAGGSSATAVPWIGDGRPERTGAAWYEAEPAPEFRATFVLPPGKKEVKVDFACAGFGWYGLNGTAMMNADGLDTLWSVYDKTVYSFPRTLTVGKDGLKPAPATNEIVVRLGNGFYNLPPLRFWGRFCFRDFLAHGRPCFRLTVDGRPLDWTWRQTDVVRNSVYLGTEIDATRAEDVAWRPAAAVSGPKGRIVDWPQTNPQMGVHETHHGTVRWLKPGEVQVVDFGVNASGTADFTFRNEARGTRVEIVYGERLNPDGTVNVLTQTAGQIKSPGKGGPGAPDLACQRDAYVCGGGGDERFRPPFTWHICRYAEIRGAKNPVVRPARQVRSMVSTSAGLAPSAQAFGTDDAELAKLHALCRRTFQANLIGGIQSDCPGRERLGYGGDIAVSCEAMCRNFDMKEIYLKVLQDFADEAADDGWITETAPFVGIADAKGLSAGGAKRAGPVSWTVGVPVLMETVMRHYPEAKERVLAFYPTCTRYLRQMDALYPTGVVPSCIGDHEALERAPNEVTATAHWHEFVRLTAGFAKRLGRADDQKEFEAIAAKISRAFAEKFVRDGIVANGTQSAQAIGLYLGLVPAGQVAAAERRLVAAIEEKGCAPHTGIFSTRYMLIYLAEHGQNELARRIVLHRGFPGWLHMLDSGATTLWETWKESDDIYSNCHPMFGSVDEWILRFGGTRTLTIDRACRYERGFVRDGDELVVDNGSDATRSGGALWRISLEQKEPVPFSVRVAARCEAGPGGGRVRDFSLYLDMTYVDGGHLWGQVAEFAPNPDLGWRTGVVTVLPTRPVKNARVYCLYRNLPGRVRFGQPEVRTLSADSVIFDSQAVRLSDLPKCREGFLVRDVRESDGRFETIAAPGEAKGLLLAVRETAGRDGDAHVSVTVEELTGRDRAVTLVYAVPLPPGDIVFEADPRTSVPLGPLSVQSADTRSAGCGAGGLNRWPFGAVSVGGKGLALGIDTAAPAFFRTAVHPRARLLFIAFDLGFAPEKRTAAFAFRRFSFAGGFRGALAKYATLEPEAFRVRLSQHGIWMPFRKTSEVKGWEDFGFRFKEGDNETAWDDAHGLLTFHYTEPTTWWFRMDRPHGTNAYTFAQCKARVEAKAREGDPMAVAWRESCIVDADGQPAGSVKDTPWCRGAVWLLSPLPGIAGACEYKVKHAESDYEKRYAAASPTGVDGEYIDSAECYLTPVLDYNRKVFAASETPLVFSSDDGRPALFKGLSLYEYARRTAQRVWRRGRHTMANGVPGCWPWLPAYVDVGGTETKWIDREGRWQPESHESLIYKRAMSMGKPYCYLQNVDFTKFRYADMENFMRHCVAYGFFPGCFSHNASEGHYFSRPEIYNRDRPLFKRYVPVCKRLSEAGWRPVNALVTTSEPRVYAEQFGDRYATVFNAAKKPVKVRLTARPNARAEELVAGGRVAFDAKGEAVVDLPPDGVLALSF